MSSSAVLSSQIVPHLQKQDRYYRTHSIITEAEKKPSTATVEFHLTAFSRFWNVLVNPTELILEGLPAHLRDHPLTHRSKIVTTSVLKSAAETTLKELNTLYARHAQQPWHGAPQRRPVPRRPTFVHLGANMAAKCFKLELQARNEATFSCPDELSWRPIRESIDPDDSDITLRRHTSLNLQALTDRLNSRGFETDISTDGGTFVCNWVYFNSLKLAKDNSACALFVHVPPASVVPIQEQIQFIAALLEGIALQH